MYAVYEHMSISIQYMRNQLTRITYILVRVYLSCTVNIFFIVQVPLYSLCALRAASFNDNLYPCRIEKFDFLKLCLEDIYSN